MKFVKYGNGEYYLNRKGSSSKDGGKSYRDWWFIKYYVHKYSHIGIIRLTDCFIPKELVGKKVRIKLEVLQELKKEVDNQKP